MGPRGVSPNFIQTGDELYSYFARPGGVPYFAAAQCR